MGIFFWRERRPDCMIGEVSGYGVVTESRRLFPRMESEIVFANRTSSARLVTVVIQLSDGRAPYENRMVVRDPAQLAVLQPGSSVPVVVHTDDMRRFYLDWSALDRHRSA